MEETGRIYEALGPRLVRLRQERGLSQQELARALHVTRQAVSNWERGKTVPDVGTLCRLGEILQVDWNGLCGEDGAAAQTAKAVCPAGGDGSGSAPDSGGDLGRCSPPPDRHRGDGPAGKSPASGR